MADSASEVDAGGLDHLSPEALHAAARAVLPGGTAAAARIHPALGRPFYISRAEGARVYDREGRAYFDLCNSHGATLLGHGHPAIRRAIIQALDLGLACAYETADQAAVARRLTEIIPCADLVRFTNSGTEATWHALRAARAYTGKPKVLKFEGHFHGYHDFLGYSSWPALDRAGPEAAPFAVPESAGMLPEAAGACLVLPFNDLELLERTVGRHQHELAAVILEPLNYNAWAIRPQPRYLESLRALTAELGIVLIFDEILSGFRTGPGGIQAYSGVTPDLCTLGKALGGGTPLSAFMGKREIMATTGPLGPVMHSGTYNAHLIPILAARAFLAEIAAPGFYPHLLANSERLMAGLTELLRTHGIKGRVQGTGARFSLLFGVDEEVTSYRHAARRDQQTERRFFAACLHHGVYTLGHHHGLSAAYTAEDVDDLLERLDAALADVAAGR